MPRVPKPFLYRNWYCTKAGGERVKLCPEVAGIEAAERKLAEHLAGLVPPEPAPAADPEAVFLAAWGKMNRGQRLRALTQIISDLI